MAENEKKSPLIVYGAIAIILLMLLSGVGVFFASQNTNPNPTPSTGTPNPNAPTITLIASEVPATVQQLFPSAVIISNTRETDKTKLDEALGKMQGVRTIKSQFNALDANGTVSYLGELSLSVDANHETLVEQIFQSGLFTSPEIYFQAQVKIPAQVNASTQDGNSQLVKLPTTQTLGYVNLSTRVQDEISGTLQILMQDNQVRNAFLFESQNITQSPKPISLTINAPISNLQPRLIASGSIHYIPAPDENVIQANLSQRLIGKGSVTDIFLPRKDNQLLLQFTNPQSAIADVNAWINSHPSQYTSFSADATGMQVGLGFVSLAQAKQELQAAIDNAMHTNTAISFTDPTTQLLVDVNLSNLAQAAAAAQAIQSYFTSLDSNASIQVYQPASITLASIQDNNQSISIPNGTLTAYVFPSHAVNDSISVQLSGTTVNGSIVEISGLEADANASH